MKLIPISVTTTIGLLCFAISSCNPADPSVISEAQKALAEASAKNIRLTDEVAALKTELKEAQAKTEQAEEQAKTKPVEIPKMPDITGIESKLDKVLTMLEKNREAASQAATAAAVAVQNARDNPPAAPDATKPSNPQQPPAAPAKPKPKYDINFDNPVMGPGAR